MQSEQLTDPHGEGVWCEYELDRLPREEFEFTTDYGLVHMRSQFDAPPHSTTGLEVPAGRVVAAEPALNAPVIAGDNSWEVPLIEPIGDG